MKSNVLWNVSLLGALSVTFLLFQNCSPNMKFSVHEPTVEQSASLSSTTPPTGTPSTPRTPRAPAAPVVPLTIQEKADQICMAADRGLNWNRVDWSNSANDASNANPCVIQMKDSDYLVERCSTAGFSDAGSNFQASRDLVIDAADTIAEFRFPGQAGDIFANVKNLGKAFWNGHEVNLNALNLGELETASLPCLWTNNAGKITVRGFQSQNGSASATEAVIYGTPLNGRKASIDYLNIDTQPHVSNHAILLDVNVGVIRMASTNSKIRLKNTIVQYLCASNSSTVVEIENAGVVTYIKDLNDPRCQAPAN